MQEKEIDRTLGMTDDEMTLRFRKAIELEKALKTARGEPIAQFDQQTQKAYLEYPDGRREYV